MYKAIQEYIETLDTNKIAEDRLALLQPMVAYMQSKLAEAKPIRFNFICTHNSRRSHLGQVWAQTMANYYGLKNLQAYSGGTETTAVFAIIIKTLQNIGFEIHGESVDDNPIYWIRFNPVDAPLVGFSKTYDHFYNPKNNFAAVMTCDHADKNCPFIPGAEVRFNLNYVDPKMADGTPAMERVYREKSQEIATEMKFIFQKLKNSI